FNWRQQCAWIVGLLTLYTALMLLVAVPDLNGNVGAGVLEPGRDWGAFVDRSLLGGHLWSQSKTWDPEGIVSTLSALCSQLFGVLAGRFIGAQRSGPKRARVMTLAGSGCLAVGAMLDATVMRINKSLWTTSYCLAMTGW